MRAAFLCSSVGLLALAAVTPAAAQPSEHNRLHWVTNGAVHAAAVQEQTLFIGGGFTRVAPAANFLGPWFAVSVATGAPGPRLPLADAAVLAIEPDEAGGYFVGGRFTQIGGVARTALAHVLADGRVDPAFAPILHPAFPEPPLPAVLDVRTLVRVGSTLYVGGSFRIEGGGASREGVAALDAANGALLTWYNVPTRTRAEKLLAHDGRLFAMGETYPTPFPADVPVVFASDAASGTLLWSATLGTFGRLADAVIAGPRLIVAGLFTGPGAPALVASLDPATGTIDMSWRPFTSVGGLEMDTVTALGSTVYVAGRLATSQSAFLAAIPLGTGVAMPWGPVVNGPVHRLVPASPSSVYVAGAFRNVGASEREGLAEIDAAGAVTAWASRAYSRSVHALSVSGGLVLAGGTSAVADGVRRDHVAAFALHAGDVLPWTPVAGAEVTALAVDGRLVFAGLGGEASGSPSQPPIVAFDAATGAPAQWGAPPNARRLLGAFDGHVYYTTDAGQLHRVNTAVFTVDTSWRLKGGPETRVLRDGPTLYLYAGPHVPQTGELRDVAAVQLSTGAVSGWNPDIVPGSPMFGDATPAATIVGRTMFVAYERINGRGVVAVDLQTARRVQFDAAPPSRVRDLGSVDDLVLAVLEEGGGTTGRLQAYHLNGAPAVWAPGLMGIAPAGSWPWQPRILATSSDVIVTGMQRLDGVPVHGVAVFARGGAASPSALDATVAGSAVRLRWAPPHPSPESYIIEAGSASGTSNLLVQDTASAVPAFDATAPDGTYFVRIRAAGAAPGTTAAFPTNEIALRVGCSMPPAPPTRLAASLQGSLVTLSWEPSAFSEVSRYVIEAGSAPGLGNLARLMLTGATTTFSTVAPPGVYHVRVRAENACGSGTPTPDVWLAVGGTLPAAPTGLTIRDLTPHAPPEVPHHYQVEWSPVPGATAYVLEVGSHPGWTDVLSAVVTSTRIGPAAAAWSLTHFVRVRAIGPAGIGPPSAEFVLIAQ